MDDFEQTVQYVRNELKEASDESKAKIYGLYKQATVGDVNIERPSGLLDWTGKAKWDAWKACEGISQEEAKVQYCSYVNDLSSA